MIRQRRDRLWWLASFVAPMIFGVAALVEGFSGDYVVADDARMYVAWLEGYAEDGLYPSSFVADYVKTITPLGYRALYWVAAQIGIEPLTLAKLLPIVLGLIATWFCYALAMQILPSAPAAFLCTLLLNYTAWRGNDLVSGTPRAFIYVVLLSFLVYLVRRSVLGVAVTVGLIGLFYPAMLLIAAGLALIRLVRWERLRPKLSRLRPDYILAAAGVGVAGLVMLRYALQVSEFGPLATRGAAQGMQEFGPGGRTELFGGSFADYWLRSSRSGLLPELPRLQALASLALPLVFVFRRHFPLARRLTGEARLLVQLAVVGIACWALAHVVLFRLYLPSRYVDQPGQVVVSLAGGIALAIILDRLVLAVRGRSLSVPSWQPLLAAGAAGAIVIAVALYPVLTRDSIAPDSYVKGNAGEVYEAIASQPKDTVVASLSREADNVPAFSRRPVLVGFEFAITYEVGYYERFRRRAIAIMRAQYAGDLGPARSLIPKFGVDLWLVDKDAFERDYFDRHTWLRAYAVPTGASRRLANGAPMAMPNALRRCALAESETVIVARARCVANTPRGSR